VHPHKDLGRQDDLVARAKSLSACPVISSLRPDEYTLAVSKKLIPASSACRTMSRQAASSSVHGRPRSPGSPKLMHPSVITETSSPVLPSFPYRIESSCGVIARQISRRS
jgi:hypothetical protein